MERTFDRLVQFDPRSRSFAIRELLPVKPFRSYTWRCLQWNDQGQEGACVGFAWSHEISARPVELRVSEDVATAIYRRARQIDQWPGEDYDGTSVIAGVKAAKEMGYLTEYRWAFSLDDLRRAIGYFGPAVLGVNWYEGMFETDERGYLHPSGELMGGHAILCNGVNEKDQCVRLHNSWGRTWGVDGHAYVSFTDLERLLHEDGEACIPSIRRKPPTQ